MIRTAVLFPNYGPYHLAGAESFSKVEAIEAHFVELAPSQERYPWQTARDGLDFRITTLVNTPLEGIPLSRLVKELHKTLNALRPQALVISGYRRPTMLAAARWARAHGAASIMMSDTTALDRERAWWKEQIKRQLVNRYYDAGFVSGRASRQYLHTLGMPQARIWERNYVVNNTYFGESSRRLSERADEHRKRTGLPERYFLYVGRFSPEKNLARLLQAYRYYRDSDPKGWKLVLVGDGPQREELLQLARDLELIDIVWPGFKQVDELPPYYALSSGFILPSFSEPWGLVVNEAMACGLPVLVSDRCGSAPDLVTEGGNGYIFDPFSVDEISARMLKLARLGENERHTMGETSQRIISSYTPEARAENLADCIRQTVARVQRDGEGS